MAIARVQSQSGNTAATNASSLVITLGAQPTPGNLLVVAAQQGVGGGTAAKMLNQTGLTWLQTTKVGSSSAGTLLLAYARVASSIAASTVTLSNNASVPIAAVVVEYSGVNIRLDRLVGGTGQSTSPASGATETTGTANELWVGCLAARSAASAITYSSPTNSFSIVAQTNTTNGGSNLDACVAFLEKIVTSTGTANAGATASSSCNWIASVATFDEVPAGSLGIPSIGT